MSVMALLIAVLMFGTWRLAGPGGEPASRDWRDRQWRDETALVPSAEPTGNSVPAALWGGEVEPPKSGAYIGVFQAGVPWSRPVSGRHFAALGKQPAIVHWFQPWGSTGVNGFDKAAVARVWSWDAIPLISWEPWSPGNDSNFVKSPEKSTDYQLSQITAGAHDEYIRGWAKAIRAVGGPVMLRPMHEANGNWYPWCGTVNGNSPKQYIAAWRHMHAIFEDEGASNVTWVWSVNHQSVPDTPANAYSKYYPGDGYVDWTSLSGFNWGESLTWSKWTEFEAIYSEPLGYLGKIGKPIVLSEMASVSKGGDKDAWIRDAYSAIESKYPQVKAVVYYDKDERRPEDSQDWSIQSTASGARAFSRALQGDHFVGGPPRSLELWEAGLSEEDLQVLKGFVPMYGEFSD